MQEAILPMSILRRMHFVIGASRLRLKRDRSEKMKVRRDLLSRSQGMPLVRKNFHLGGH
jgi:hypothetical protein